MNRLDPHLLHARLFVRSVLDLKRSPFRLSLKAKLRAWTLGFTEWSYLLYALDSNSPDDFLSDRHYTLYGGRPLGRRLALLEDKWNAELLLTRAGIPQPITFGEIIGGRFHSDLRSPVGDLSALLAQEKRLVVKPTYGAGGWAILFLEQVDSEIKANGKVVTSVQLERIVSFYQSAIVTSFASQADYAARVFPQTTNTLRLLVLWDDRKEEPFLAAAAHRFGAGRSSLIDNFHGGHNGGLSVPISPDGVLGKGMHLDRCGERIYFSNHPDTGEPIEGVEIPGWHQTIGELLDKIKTLPLLAMGLGWDLVKTRTGWVCIEANPAPGIKVWQAHGGLLSDPRARRFYQKPGKHFRK